MKGMQRGWQGTILALVIVMVMVAFSAHSGGAAGRVFL